MIVGNVDCRLHKLKQKHLQMQSVVQRAASGRTEHVSWEDDDSDHPAPKATDTGQGEYPGAPCSGVAAFASVCGH